MFDLLSRPGRLALLLAGLLGTIPCGAAPAAEPFRNTEMKVELAWMAEPATFHCPLQARCTSSGLDVLGRVADEASRTRALNLAREQVRSTVRDCLTIGPVDGSFVPCSREELGRGIMAALSELVATTGTTLKVGRGSDGRVTLRGQVPSLAEKHRASVQLRQVKGCCCVINLLEIPAAPVVLPEFSLKTSQPEPMTAAVEKVAPTPPAVNTIASSPPAPLPLPTSVPDVARSMWTPSIAVRSSDSPASPYGSRRVPSAPTTEAIATCSPYRSAAQPVAFSEPLPPSPQPTPMPPKTVFATLPAPAKPAPASARTSRGLLAGQIGSEQATKPVAPVRPTIPDKPYVTTGIVFFDDPKPEPPPVSRSTTVLRHKLLAACGKTVKSVRVLENPDASMQVTFTVSRKNAIQEVLNRTMKLPEMASSQTRLAFEVEP